MHINFVTHRKIKLDLKTIKEIKLNNLLMVIVAGAAIFLMILFGMVQKMRLSHMQSEKMSVEMSISNLKNELASKGLVAAALAGKASLLNNFEMRTVWSRVLRELAVNIPAGLWIQSIKAGAEDKRLVDISGIAPNQSAVASLMGILDNVDLFSDVKLVSSSASDKEQSGKIKFAIKIKLK